MNDLRRIHYRSICHDALTRLASKRNRNLISPIDSHFIFPRSPALHTYIFCNITRNTERGEIVHKRICRRVMTLWANLPSLFRLDFQTSYILPRLFMCVLLSDTSSHGTNMFLALFLISQRGKGREGGRMIYFSENIIVRHRLLGLCVCLRVCTRESALYIYIRKPSVCWIFIRQIVRLSGFAVPIFSKEAVPVRLGRSSCSLADAAENSFVRHRVYGVHYRLRNKSRNRYRSDSPT